MHCDKTVTTHREPDIYFHSLYIRNPVCRQKTQDAYKSLVRLVVEYASTVWSHIQRTLLKSRVCSASQLAGLCPIGIVQAVFLQ